MNLKNSIESIEIYNLGIFSSMLTKKYKFIPVSDIMNIWNLNFKNKTPDPVFPIFQNKTISNVTKNKSSAKKQPVSKNSNRVLQPRVKIQDSDCVLQPRIKIQDSDCVLQPRVKIQDSDCVLQPRVKIQDSDCVLQPRVKIQDVDCLLKIINPSIEEQNEKPEEDVDTTIENEIIESIIKKILFNEDTVSIPTYLTNYLNSNKIAMNIEKIIEYDDIEEILQDINF